MLHVTGVGFLASLLVGILQTACSRFSCDCPPIRERHVEQSLELTEAVRHNDDGNSAEHPLSRSIQRDNRHPGREPDDQLRDSEWRVHGELPNAEGVRLVSHTPSSIRTHPGASLNYGSRCTVAQAQSRELTKSMRM